MPRINNIQVRRDTAANWTSANPVLAAGEIGYDSNANTIKIGNGSTNWNGRPYLSADGEVFYAIEPFTLSQSPFVITANKPFLVKAYGTSPNPSVKFFDAADNLLLEISGVTVAGAEYQLTTEIAYFVCTNLSAGFHWLVVTNPNAQLVENSVKILTLTGTQSLTLETAFDAYLLGGGGSGGGITGARPSVGSGGGGSGYYASGILSAGTYTATIGAGAGGNLGSGTSGGTTSIGTLSAAGGSGGTTAADGTTPGVGAAGGSGGTGGTRTDVWPFGIANTAPAGFQGGNGSTGTGSFGAAGGAGSGVSIPSPIQVLAYGQTVTLLTAATSGANNNSAAGVYGGGSGGSAYGGSPPTPVGGGIGGGGAGAGNDSQNNNINGGSGGSGIIILIERP